MAQSILDFTDDTWQGETGDISRILLYEQENYQDEPIAALVGRVADPMNATPANRPGIYKYQVALNPDSDVAARPTFIENRALSGNLTAQEGVLGRQEILGTLNLPLTYPMGPYIRNILQSRGWSATPAATDTIVRTPATPAGLLSTLPAAAGTVIYSATQPRNAAAITTHTGTAPASLTLTVETAVAATNLTESAGLIRLRGKDHWDADLVEDFVIPAGTAADTAFESQYFWKNVDTYETIGFVTTYAGTFKVEVRNDAQLVTFKPYDLGMISYLLLEFDKGNVPNVYRGLYAAGAILVVEGQDALAELQIPVGGRKPLLYENLAGTKVPFPPVAGTDYRTPVPADVETVSGPVMDTNRVTMTLGTTDIRLPIINLRFDFGLNFETSPVISGDPEETPQPIRRRRQPIISGEYQYSLASNFSTAALNNIKADFLKLRFPQRSLGGFPGYHEIQARKTQFQEAGDPAAAEGAMRQAFSMLGLPSQAGVSDDLQWSMFVPYYQDVRNFQ